VIRLIDGLSVVIVFLFIFLLSHTGVYQLVILPRQERD
jgi:hypothetical protein